MLDFQDVDLARREITAARAAAERQMRNYDRIKRAYVGAFWDSAEGGAQFGLGEEPSPTSNDGTRYEYVALLMGRMAYKVPSVAVSSRRAGPSEQVAIAMKHALNRIIVDSNYKELQRQSAVDFLFSHSVLHLSRTASPYGGGEYAELNPQWPEANRISSRHFFQDAAALAPDLVRYMGHDTYLDKEDLVRSAEQDNEEEPDERYRWDLEAIQAIPEGPHDDNGRWDVPDRKQVRLTTVWVQGYEDSDHPGSEAGYHGTVFYYGSSPNDDDDAYLLLKEEPFYGPPWGPYYVGSAYHVPDSPFGLAPLVAAEGQLREQEKHAKAVGDSAASYKKLLFVDSPDNTLGQRVANSPHLHVHNVAGLERNRMVEASFGGADQQSVQYYALVKDRVDRMLGISDAMRGVAAGRATATETALAGQAGDIRIAWVQSRFLEFHERLFAGMSWYLWRDEDMVVPMSPDAVEELGGPREATVMFQGGETEGMAWEDLELRIELRSTEHESDQAKLAKVQAGQQVLITCAQISVNAPWINWEEVIRRQGEALGLPRLHELWDQDMFEQFVARQLQMQFNHQQRANEESRLQSHPGPAPAATAARPAQPQMPQAPAGSSVGAQLGAQARGGSTPTVQDMMGG